MAEGVYSQQPLLVASADRDPRQLLAVGLDNSLGQ